MFGANAFGWPYPAQGPLTVEQEAAAPAQIPFWRPGFRHFPKYITEAMDRKWWWYREPPVRLVIDGKASLHSRSRLVIQAHIQRTPLPSLDPLPSLSRPSPARREAVTILGEVAYRRESVAFPDWLPVALSAIEMAEDEEEELVLR